MPGPLKGIRVLDLSRILAGPWATQLLGDLGAEVIKIERPGGGDDTRSWGPPFANAPHPGADPVSAYFLSTNRGKRSVAVDFTHPGGQRVVAGLVARTDVFIENFKRGGLARYGLDYPTLSGLNPGLVYCSITGFGQTGPDRDRAGYDFMIQGMGGLMSVTGQPDGTPGAEPMKVGVAMADVLTGLYAANAIQAALLQRGTGGRGQFIDLALFDVQLATLANQAMNYLVSGTSPSRLGNSHPNIVPYQAFTASDGYFVIAAGNDRQFADLCAVAGVPELSADRRFHTNADRVRNRDVLIPLLAARISQAPCGHWLRTLNAAAVPCGPINSVAQAFAEPQARARGMRLDLPLGNAGATVPSVANPIRYSETGIEYADAAPLLGEHTEAVLRGELGLTDSDIHELRAEGCIT